MTKHLAGCAARLGAEGVVREVLRVRVEAPGSPYWLDVQVLPDGALRDLDGFLRAHWLECCGHLSAFRDGGGKVAVSRRWSDLPPDADLTYEYDFGSTTELRVRVLAHETAPVPDDRKRGRNRVRLLARNVPPRVECARCEHPATKLDLMDQDDDGGILVLCEVHARQHANRLGDDAYVVPLVNSPRTGVCGFDGPPDRTYENWPPAGAGGQG